MGILMTYRFHLESIGLVEVKQWGGNVPTTEPE